MPRDASGRSRAADAFIRRLEDRIDELTQGKARVALAYSGGLASTVVGTVARKRCELECFVAGATGCRDVRAAESARQHLDFRIRHVVLDADSAKRIRAQVEEARPILPVETVLSLVPAVVVLGLADRDSWLTGFGGRTMEPSLAVALRSLRLEAPLADLREQSDFSRTRMQRAARGLGLPEGWVRARHRAPADGSGVKQLLTSADEGPRRLSRRSLGQQPL